LVGKVAMLVLVGALMAASLLVVRQQRLHAVREMAEAAERAARFDRTLWRVRVEIARRITPEGVHDMATSVGPLKPIPTPWSEPVLASAEVSSAPQVQQASPLPAPPVRHTTPAPAPRSSPGVQRDRLADSRSPHR